MDFLSSIYIFLNFFWISDIFVSFFHFWDSIYIFLNFFLLFEPLAQIFFLIFSWISIYNFLNFFSFWFYFFYNFFLSEISQATTCFLKFSDSEIFCLFWKFELFRFCENFLIFFITSISHATKAWQAFLKKNNCYEKLFEGMKKSFKTEKKNVFWNYIMYFRFFHGTFLLKNTRHYTFHDQGLFHLFWLMPLHVRKISFFWNSQFFWFWFENIFSSFSFIDDEFSIIFCVVFDAEKSAFFNSSKSSQKRRKRQKFLKFNRYFSFFNRTLFIRVHFDLLSAQQ